MCRSTNSFYLLFENLNFMTILCLVACMAWIVGLMWMVLCPIERDRQLSYGKASNLMLIILAIVTLPLVLTFLLNKFNVMPEELVYDDQMYQKWQPYPFQQQVDSTSYTVLAGDTTLIYSPKNFRELQMDEGRYEDPSLVWTVYYQFVNPGGQNMASTSRGRIIAFVLAMLGMVLMTGLLISLISNFFQRRIERWRTGQIRYTHGLGRHCIVIGANNMMACTIRQIEERYGKHMQHVIVLTQQNVEQVRRQLYSELPTSLEKKVVFYAGSLTERDEIANLRCHEADEVFILGVGTMNDAEHDTTNLQCLKLIADSLPTGKEQLRVQVLLNDMSTYSVFQMSELTEEQQEKIEFMPFNIYETWARKVLVENRAEEIQYEPLDSKQGIRKADDKYVHLVVAGMTNMGMQLAVEAAHIAHYPNYARDHRLKTIITFVDTDIEEKKRDFKARYRELFDVYEGDNRHLVTADEEENFLDVEWEFVEGSLKDRDFVHQCVELMIGEQTLMTLALCQEQVEEVMTTVLSLPQSLYQKVTQVLVCQLGSDEILKVLSRSPKTYFSKVRPFGMISSCVNLAYKQMPLSKLLNYAYNHPEDIEMKHAMEDDEGNYCDNVSKLWAQQTTANKWSNIYNSDSIPTKLRSVGKLLAAGVDVTLSEEEVKTIAEVEHRRWNMEKLLMGFRTLTAEEQALCLHEGKTAKNRLKNEMMAHLDICSQKRLQEVDQASVEYDEVVTNIIPTMIKEHFTPLPDPWK